MFWSGKTRKQRDKAARKWQNKWAYIPTQMDSGTWLWMEFYQVRLLTSTFPHTWQFRSHYDPVSWSSEWVPKGPPPSPPKD